MTFGIASSAGSRRVGVPPTAQHGWRAKAKMSLSTAAARSNEEVVVKTNQNQAPDREARMRQRIKQVSIGKETEGYRNYLRVVPVESRVEGLHMPTPSTSPTTITQMSKRQFHAELKEWRKFLHSFDDDEVHALNSSDGEAPRSQTACPEQDEDGSSSNTDTMVFCIPPPQRDGCYEEGPMMHGEYADQQDYEPEWDAQYQQPYYPEQYPEMEMHGDYDYAPEEPYRHEVYGIEVSEAEPQEPAGFFPCEPTSQPPPLLSVPDLSYTSLVEGTPMTNLEAIEAQLIALN